MIFVTEKIDIDMNIYIQGVVGINGICIDRSHVLTEKGLYILCYRGSLALPTRKLA